MPHWLRIRSKNYESLTNDENPPGFEENSANSDPSSCALCKTIKNHKELVQKSIESVKKNCPKIDIAQFKSIPICTIKTSKNPDPLTLYDIENRYAKSHSEWNKKCQCFPEGPLFYDKLFKEEPFTRAIDIEEKRDDLEKKIIQIDFESIRFANNDDICEKTKELILDSLQEVIKDLNLTSNHRIMNGLKNGLSKQINGKISQLKDRLTLKLAINELQIKAFKMVLQNDTNFKLYEMRLVILLNCFEFIVFVECINNKQNFS